MKKQVTMLKEIEDFEGICKHYWLIEPPNGANSNGICKKCSTTRDFTNSIQEQNMSYKEKMWAWKRKKKKAALKAAQEEFSNE